MFGDLIKSLYCTISLQMIWSLDCSCGAGSQTPRLSYLKRLGKEGNMSFLVLETEMEGIWLGNHTETFPSGIPQTETFPSRIQAVFSCFSVILKCFQTISVMSPPS